MNNLLRRLLMSGLLGVVLAAASGVPAHALMSQNHNETVVFDRRREEA